MNYLKRGFLFVYQWLLFLPIFFILTVITAIVVMLMSPLFGNKIWGYYPPKWWSKLTCWLALCRVQRIAKGKLNSKQSYIFVANHQGAFDIFLVYGFLGQNIKWVQKQSLRKLPFVGFASEVAGHVFVDNRSNATRVRTISQAKTRIKNGVSMMMFPEGSRTETGKMSRFKRGAFQLAIDMKLPIVPLTINGAYDVFPIHRKLIYPGKLELIIHEPIQTAHLCQTDVPQLMEQTRDIIYSGLWDKYR